MNKNIEMTKGTIRFGGNLTALGGVGIAVGLPAVVLVAGKELGVTVQTIIIFLALLSGGTLATISAFFGTVIPSKLGGSVSPNFWDKNKVPNVKITKSKDGKVVEISGTATESSPDPSPASDQQDD